MSEDAFVQFIRLHTGELIDPATREIVQPRKVDEVREEQSDLEEISNVSSDELELEPLERTSIMDLPLDPVQMAFVNNVLVLTLFGLPDDEVALSCRCDVEQVQKARESDAYNHMYRALIEGLRRAYVNTVHGVLQDSSVLAAKTVRHTLKKSKSADLRFQASKDVLDRTGHRPADKVEHIHTLKQEDELVIRVLRDDDQGKMPTIDLKPVNNA